MIEILKSIICKSTRCQLTDDEIALIRQHKLVGIMKQHNTKVSKQFKTIWEEYKATAICDYGYATDRYGNPLHIDIPILPVKITE